MREPLIPHLRNSLHDQTGSVKSKIIGIYGALLIFNVGTWCWAVVVFHRNPVLWAAAILAYSFGLRHAVDADHIAAIDNVTRKMMQDGDQPVAVGLMFSLGHSSVVIVGSMIIALTASTLRNHFATARALGQFAGTLISTFFLFGIAIVNLMILRSTYRSFKRIRRGEAYVESDGDYLTNGSGLLFRIARPLFSMVRRSWHIHPLGVLFGLGFDTATEIGLLGISATEASSNLALWSILIFPLLFAASMSLIDTTDNILMLGAYGWAFVKPVRKLYYNLTITCTSVLVAVVTGTAESMGLLAGRFHLTGTFWYIVRKMNDNYSLMGYCIIALFAASWIGSFLIYKWQHFEEIE